MVIHGDCLEELRKLPDASADSLVTDPPAGISFMGKAWDDDKGGRDEWIKWLSEVMRECRRVLKPGAHALVWSIPRTSHWTATAIEAAGFEIRDVVTHLFGSGFPKSLDVSKAIDKAAGAERVTVGHKEYSAPDIRGNSYDQAHVSERERLGVPITAPSTDAAKQWQGWGTALKPAAEFWILARNPLTEKTVAANVCKHGTGALNIDGCRIGTETISQHGRADSENVSMSGRNYAQPAGRQWTGRFPANLVLSHSPECGETCAPGCAVAELDAQSGVGASRFFYCAKISPSERNAGLDGFDKKPGLEKPLRTMSDPRMDRPQIRNQNQNNHPTVKPLKLMRYFIRLITPPGGLVLDPFAGSGSTGVAAIQDGFQFIGIEKEPEYVEIAKARMEHARGLFKETE